MERGDRRRRVQHQRRRGRRRAPAARAGGSRRTPRRCSARMVRSAADGSGASGAIEPLAASGSELPSGVTKLSGGGRRTARARALRAHGAAVRGRGRAPGPGRRRAPSGCTGRRFRCASAVRQPGSVASDRRQRARSTTPKRRSSSADSSGREQVTLPEVASEVEQRLQL